TSHIYTLSLHDALPISSFIDLTPLDPGTPKALIQVGEEIWISDQFRDRIDRFDLDGIHLGAITGGMDNIKGMELVNGSEVWLTRSEEHTSELQSRENIV